MDLITFSIVVLVGMIFLIFIGVPIAFALGAAGIVGMVFSVGITATLSQISMLAWGKGTDFVMICIPMFIFMGQVVFYTGIASDLYDFLQKWFGRLPGGLAIASVGACGGFGAVTGSSVACVATMGAIIIPEMKKFGYNDRLATGVLAASGTLGILIPPSLGFVFYGILTDTSIAALFMAGIVPGILTVVLYSLFIFTRCLINPEIAPKGPRYSWKEKLLSLRLTWPVLTIFVVVIGGLYGGFFTPTEASGIGAVGILFISLIKKRLTWDRLKSAVNDTGVISAMIFAVVVAGYMLSRFLAITEITPLLIEQIVLLNPNRYLFVFIIFILYLFLGMMLELFGIAVLTIPFVFPIILQLGFDAVWFGVFITIMAEIAMITPPIGVNVFVMRSIATDVPMEDIFLGVLPFLFINALLILLFVIFPDLVLWIPRLAGLM